MYLSNIRLFFSARKSLASLFVLLLLFLATIVIVFQIKNTQEIRKKASESSKVTTPSIVDFLTQDIFAKSQKMKNVSGIEKNNLMSTLKNLAKQRSDLLITEMLKNQNQFPSHVFSPFQLKLIPQELIQEHLIEQNISLKGELFTIHSDNFANKTSEINFRIKTNDNQGKSVEYQVFFHKHPPEIPSGQKVELKGILVGDKVITATGRNPDIKYESQFPGNRSTGEFKTAVILFNFNNDSSQPYSTPDIQNVMFNTSQSVNSFYKENSYNQVYFTGNVFDWTTIPYDNTDCGNKLLLWAGAANNSLQQQGVDLSVYHRFVYIFPSTSSCNFGGAAYVFGVETFINGLWPLDRLTGVISHELGHNFGLLHAANLNCSPKSIDDYRLCNGYEYGDPYEVMGLAPALHLYAGNKNLLGWIPDSQRLDVSSSGTFELAPQEIGNQRIQTIKINKPDTANSYCDNAYILEYRRPYGYDSLLPSGITDGILIHTQLQNCQQYVRRTVGSRILDAFPISPGDYSDASLKDGYLFRDLINNIEIKQLSHNNEKATVLINFSLPTPTPTPTPLPNPQYKNALMINSQNSGYISIPYRENLSLNNTFTLEGWVNLNNRFDTNIILSQNFSSNTLPSFTFATDLGQLVFQFYDPSGQESLVYSTNRLEIGQWYYVTVVKDGSTVRFFIDGILDSNFTVPNNIIKTNTKLSVGARLYNEQIEIPFNGIIDDLKISDKAIYSGNFDLKPSPNISDNNTLVLYHFDEENGTNHVIDSSSYANQGSVIGSVNFTKSTIPIIIAPTVSLAPTPTPTSTPTPTPTPIPTPTPDPNNARPWFITGSIPKGKVGIKYLANIQAGDWNKDDTLTMDFIKLPEGITKGKCTEQYRQNIKYFTCQLSGIPQKVGKYAIFASIIDDKKAKSEKTFILEIKN